MNFTVLNYSNDGSLTPAAVIFGKHNLKLIESGNDFNLYEYDLNINEKIFFPIKKNNYRLQFDEVAIILQEFPHLVDCKKIVWLPSESDFGNKIIDTFKNDILVHITLQGDPVNVTYDYKNIKWISSVAPHIKSDSELFVDLKLSLPYYFYRHQISLVDFEKVGVIETPNVLDKIFYYGRRLEENDVNQKNRAYFITKIKGFLNSDWFVTSNIHKNIEFSNIGVGLYHFGNFFDYKCCMFNLIFESLSVDCVRDYQVWISEKTLFAVLFSNPFILFANNYVLNTLKEMDIRILNDEFDGNNVEEKVINFCHFMNNSSYAERRELYEKYLKISEQNRKHLLEYINNPKKDIINFLIN
jgi:hypothetical protein